jgi:sugar-specific transcriptional regulator TrmB
MDSVQHKLEEVGLSAKAAQVYLALLQLGSGTVHDIASRADVVRTTCYPLLEELQKRGLVTTTRSGKKTIYVAEHPDQLVDSIEQTASAARAIIPTLAHMLAGNSKRPKIEVYEGVAGVWRAYEDVIAGEDYEVKAFVPADEAVTIAGDRKVREYIRKRVKKGISMRAIMQKTPLIEKEYAKYNKGDLRESRFVDAKRFPMPVEIDLYPNHSIAITSFRDGLGLVIRSEPIHTALNSIFELLWASSTPTNRRGK